MNPLADRHRRSACRRPELAARTSGWGRRGRDWRHHAPRSGNGAWFHAQVKADANGAAPEVGLVERWGCHSRARPGASVNLSACFRPRPFRGHWMAAPFSSPEVTAPAAGSPTAVVSKPSSRAPWRGAGSGRTIGSRFTCFGRSVHALSPTRPTVLRSIGSKPSWSAGETGRKRKSSCSGATKRGSATSEPRSWPVSSCHSARVRSVRSFQPSVCQ